MLPSSCYWNWPSKDIQSKLIYTPKYRTFLHVLQHLVLLSVCVCVGGVVGVYDGEEEVHNNGLFHRLDRFCNNLDVRFRTHIVSESWQDSSIGEQG